MTDFTTPDADARPTRAERMGLDDPVDPTVGTAEVPVRPGLPLVAIVGRPNVGKSTLVNRIIGRRAAIVEEHPGVTRDRKEVAADWNGREFILVDTGGWMAHGSALDDKVSAQSEQAIRDADAILLVVDATVGLTDDDDRVAQILRGAEAPVLVIANKVDGPNREHLIWELLRLGLGDPHPISALHGRGTGDMLDELVAVLPEGPADDEPGPPPAEGDAREVSVAIAGRPNVGKSTLFNRLTGEDRAVVHDMPGTTRDTIDTLVETDAGPIRFVDTAGMRRKSKIDDGTEYYSLVRALQAVDLADVALLVIDATEGITHQDQRLAERIDAAGCPVIVCLNKWELLDAEQREKVTEDVGRKMAFVGEAPVLKISAATGQGTHKLLPALAGTISQYRRRVPTRKVNEVLAKAQAAQPGPHGAKVLYATQGATDPPTFTFFTNKDLPASYVRYLERSLRTAFDMGQTAIKIRVRRRS
ncbi:ribosome biogenesis GTPase Der [Iamia sp. SCSIO 61187]|uniref:ribosome biogenesis GTPase Der n=1 Tax=Iamia sp. SCSIO 61187 TaxID=2722752 RepID=UPI002103CAFE|nr:ribosome biogenesis GTPase Der [Iamia sp. SCSIO 61187]